MRKKIIILGILLVVGIVGWGFITRFPVRRGLRGGCISNPDPVFSHDITDLSKVKFITPPGSIEQYGGEKVLKSHSYVIIDGRVPVYAPVDSTLYQGSYYIEEGENQYSLFFDVSCEVFYLFDHIWEPVGKLRAALPSEPSIDTRTTEVRNPVEVKAGELVGYTTGTVYSHHFDFGVYDRNRKNDLSLFSSENLKLFDREYQALCPYDVFSEEKRLNYYSKFKNIKMDEPVPTVFCEP